MKQFVVVALAWTDSDRESVFPVAVRFNSHGAAMACRDWFHECKEIKAERIFEDNAIPQED